VFWYAAAPFIMTLAGTMFYSVIMRYFFHAPPFWSEEVLRTLFLWSVTLSAGLAIKRGMNVRVSFFVDLLHPETRRKVMLVNHALAITMLAVLVIYSFPIVELAARGHLIATGWNRAVTRIPLPIGCTIMLGYQAVLLWRTWRRQPGGG
jgi:TRAP-type C4-dicarboxylate transport system permease small subunit